MSEVQDIIDEFNMWIERGAKPRITTEETKRLINEVEKLQKIVLNLSEYHGSAEKTIKKLNSDVEKWRNTALQSSNNHGQARNKVAHLEADYIISNRELLIKQVEIDRLTADNACLTAELAELRERFEVTDDLLNQAVEALTKNIIAREIIQRFLNKEGGCRFCEYDKYLPLDAPKNGHEESCLYLAARAYLDNDTSTVVKRDLSDAEIEELGAQEAEKRGDK